MITSHTRSDYVITCHWEAPFLPLLSWTSIYMRTKGLQCSYEVCTCLVLHQELKSGPSRNPKHDSFSGPAVVRLQDFTLKPSLLQSGGWPLSEDELEHKMIVVFVHGYFPVDESTRGFWCARVLRGDSSWKCWKSLLYVNLSGLPSYMSSDATVMA